MLLCSPGIAHWGHILFLKVHTASRTSRRPCSPGIAGQGHIMLTSEVLTALRASRRACCSACSCWSLLMNSSRAAALAAGFPEACSHVGARWRPQRPCSAVAHNLPKLY